tara:strand:- start:492 stop:950 length:459 start_codon:yes stop_codon:yes gene_type:complete
MVTKGKTVAVSGGFDPIHVGHVRMIQEAAKFGSVIVILNSDSWLENKKGYKFMSWRERSEIISCIKGVERVVAVVDKDETVCQTLRNLKSEVDLTYFANGGDRKLTNTPEMKVCDQIGVELLWNVGGEKIQSSSQLVSDARTGKRLVGGYWL